MAMQGARVADVSTGLPKAEYAAGYFTEQGIGCRRDPLQANVWYVKAAEHGDERAIARLKVIRESEAGNATGNGKKAGGKKVTKPKQSSSSPSPPSPSPPPPPPPAEGEKGDCIIM